MADSAVSAAHAVVAGLSLFPQRLSTVLREPSHVGITVAVLVWLFHNGFNLWMQYTFFYARKGSVTEWKVQPEKGEGLTGEGALRPWVPWLTLLTPKPDRPWWHTAIMLYNSVMASLFAAVTSEFFMRGWLPMHRDVLVSSSWFSHGTFLTYAAAFFWLCFEVFFACAWENVVEYYFHVTMHLPWFYRHFHKLHHTYKSPTPFDDLMIHPVDSGTYYCILYSPAWLFPLSLPAYMLYLGIMGFAGMTDHSGIRFSVPNPLHALLPGVFTEPLLYSSAEHDLHHELFTVNYGFPFMFMDYLHGTYRAPRHMKSIVDVWSSSTGGEAGGTPPAKSGQGKGRGRSVSARRPASAKRSRLASGSARSKSRQSSDRHMR